MFDWMMRAHLFFCLFFWPDRAPHSTQQLNQTKGPKRKIIRGSSWGPTRIRFPPAQELAPLKILNGMEFWNALNLW